jgi:glycine cleavage system H protein
VSAIPGDLSYTIGHEYVRFSAGDVADVGITDYAQSALGDVIYVDLPGVGTALTPSVVCGTVEAVKAVSELLSPVTGEVTGVNDALAGDPGLLNRDPYGAGWMIRVRLADPRVRDGLLTAGEYAAHIGE